MANATTWKRRVAEWRASGLTAAEFASGRGYAPSTLAWWSSRLRRVGGGASTAEVAPVPLARASGKEAPTQSATVGPAAAAATPPRRCTDQLGGPRLARVVRAPAGPAQVESEVPLVLEHAFVRVVVRRGFERATLLDVLDALDARLAQRGAQS